MQPIVEDQIYPNVTTGFTDSNAYLRELTLKSMLTLAPKLSQRTLSNSLLKFLAKLQVCQAPELPMTSFPLLLPSRRISCAMILSSHRGLCSIMCSSSWPNCRCAQHIRLPVQSLPLRLTSRRVSCAKILSSHNASYSIPSSSFWPNCRCAQHVRLPVQSLHVLLPLYCIAFAMSRFVQPA